MVPVMRALGERWRPDDPLSIAQEHLTTEVLRDVASRLRSVVAAGDLVGRLGGDEFIVVTTRLTDPTDPADVADLGHRLIEAVERPFSREDLIKLSASVGIVMIGEQADAESVLSEADSALYQAKHRGRGRVEIFDRELQSAVASDTETELALRRAIEADEPFLWSQTVTFDDGWDERE